MLSLVVREAVRAGISDIGIVVWPGDEEPYSRLLADAGARLTFVQQTEAAWLRSCGVLRAEFCDGRTVSAFRWRSYLRWGRFGRLRKAAGRSSYR